MSATALVVFSANYSGLEVYRQIKWHLVAMYVVHKVRRWQND